MHNLIYLSSATPPFSDEVLIEILSKSRQNNTRRNITGLLLYNEGSILQILEGEKEVLHALYDTISRDNRHRGLIRLIDEPIQKRSFQDWSMGFKQVSNEDWVRLSGYFNLENKNEFQNATGSGNATVVSMIKSFATVHRLV